MKSDAQRAPFLAAPVPSHEGGGTKVRTSRSVDSPSLSALSLSLIPIMSVQNISDETAS